MTTTTTLSASGYATAVRAALADLDDEVRDELCEDLEAHLAEVEADTEAPLTESLGPPEAYAAELRASAGHGDAVAPTGAMMQFSARLRRLAADEGLADLRRSLARVWPVWVVLRAVALVHVATYIVGGSGLASTISVPGLVAIAAAVWVSMRIEASRRGRVRWLLRAGDVVAAWAALVLLFDIVAGVPAYGGIPADVAADDGWTLSHPDGVPVTNIHAFTADGERLDGVLLYDADGRPIEVGDAQWEAGITTIHERDALGQPILNRYPLRQQVETYSNGTDTLVPRDVPPPQVLLPLLDDPDDAAGHELPEADQLPAPDAAPRTDDLPTDAEPGPGGPITEPTRAGSLSLVGTSWNR